MTTALRCEIYGLHLWIESQTTVNCPNTSDGALTRLWSPIPFVWREYKLTTLERFFWIAQHTGFFLTQMQCWAQERSFCSANITKSTACFTKSSKELTCKLVQHVSGSTLSLLFPKVNTVLSHEHGQRSQSHESNAGAQSEREEIPCWRLGAVLSSSKDGTYLSRNFATLGPLTLESPCV